MPKKLFLSGIFFLLSANLYAIDESAENQEEAIKLAIKKTELYIQATSCDYELPLNKDNVATIVPFIHDDLQGYKAEYLVFWQGNFNCAGGTGNYSINVTPVSVSVDYGQVYVDPELSSVGGGSQLIFKKVISVVGSNVNAEVECGIPINTGKPACESPLKVTFIKDKKNNGITQWNVTGKDADAFFNTR